VSWNENIPVSLGAEIRVSLSQQQETFVAEIDSDGDGTYESSIPATVTQGSDTNVYLPIIIK